MEYSARYDSPLGKIGLVSDGEALVELRFLERGEKVGQEVDLARGVSDGRTGAVEVFKETKRWLDQYFSGVWPDFRPKMRLVGTEFQKKVWRALLEIPYGEVRSYGEIAAEVAVWQRPLMLARAVGTAVGRNKFWLIVPCHRVVRADGGIGGYAGGVWRKEKLLVLEKRSAAQK